MYNSIKRLIEKHKIIYKLCTKIKRIVFFPVGLIQDMIGIHNVKKNINRVKQKSGEKLNVVFLMQYIPSWSKVKSLYNCMKNDCRFNVYLLCVPMEKEHKDFDQSVYDNNPTFEWFIQNGYDEAINSLISCNKFFDLKTLHPDYVICTRPYNNLLPCCYTSQELSKYCLVCMISYGVNLSSIGEDVGLNSEFFRYVHNYYVDTEETRSIVENKFRIQCISKTFRAVIKGIPVLEYMLQQKCNVLEICKNRRLLWTPRWSTDKKIGGSNFFNYKDVLLEYAKESECTDLCIRPHPLMFPNFIKTGEMTETEIDSFFAYVKALGNVRIDTSGEYITTFWNSDVLITDFSSILIEYFITAKPIIYCNSSIDIEYLNIMRDILDTCYVVNNSNELLHYLNQLKKGIDPLKEKREKLVQSIINKYAINASNNIADDIYMENHNYK